MELLKIVFVVLSHVGYNWVKSELIYRELFDELNDWNIIGGSQYFLTDLDCIQANVCLEISYETSMNKIYSTLNYYSISLVFNIYVSNSWDDTSFIIDRSYISYSCNNGVIYTIFEYDYSYAGQSIINETYLFPSNCNNNNLRVFINAYTFSGCEFVTISDIRIYGTLSNNMETFSIKSLIFYDDFSTGIDSNWDIIGHPLDAELQSENPTLGYTDYLEYCLIPPCMRMIGEVELISQNISLIGYENIDLVYDINLGSTDKFDGAGIDSDYFYVNIICNDDMNQLHPLITYGDMNESTVIFKMGKTINIPKECNESIRINFICDTGTENVFLDNIYIFGDEIPTPAPTIEPTLSSNTPSITPTIPPSESPSSAPTNAPLAINAKRNQKRRTLTYILLGFGGLLLCLLVTFAFVLGLKQGNKLLKSNKDVEMLEQPDTMSTLPSASVLDGKTSEGNINTKPTEGNNNTNKVDTIQVPNTDIGGSTPNDGDTTEAEHIKQASYMTNDDDLYDIMDTPMETTGGGPDDDNPGSV